MNSNWSKPFRVTKRRLEKSLVKEIRNGLLLKVGGFWFKTHGGPFQMVGLPDLLGCVDGLFIAIEVKRTGRINRTSPAQKKVIESIMAAGGLAFITDSRAAAIKRVKKHLKEA